MKYKIKKLNKKEIKSCLLQIRLTPKQKAKLFFAADETKKSISKVIQNYIDTL